MPDEEWFTDDDRLVAELGTAVRKGAAVPDSFVRVGKGALVWRTVDAELAELQLDTALAGSEPDGLRAGGAGGTGPRELSFAGSDLSLELEIHPDAVRGQLVPPQPGMVVVRLEDESSRVVAADDVGWFIVTPAPTGRFRLQARTPGGPSLITDWIEQP